MILHPEDLALPGCPTCHTMKCSIMLGSTTLGAAARKRSRAQSLRVIEQSDRDILIAKADISLRRQCLTEHLDTQHMEPLVS